MGPKRTFQTNEERVAYVLGYQDAIGAARMTLTGTGAVAALTVPGVGEMVQASLKGVADALAEHAEGVK